MVFLTCWAKKHIYIKLIIQLKKGYFIVIFIPYYILSCKM